MKKLLTGIVSFALVASGIVAFAHVPKAGATAGAPACNAVAVGTKNSANQNGSIFTIKNNKVTATYKLTGPANCKLTMQLISWTAPNNTDGKPYSAQKEVDRATKTAGPGTYTLTANMKDCFYQVDLVFQGSEAYSVRNIGYAHGGTHACNEKPQTPPTKPETPKTPTTPKTPVTPGKGSVEAVATTAQPEAIAKTGPEAVVAQLFGASSLAGSLGYFIQSRRR